MIDEESPPPNMLEQALKYLASGRSIIPVAQDKKPLLPSWKEYQTRLSTEKEVGGWFEHYGKRIAGLAMVTGKISGVVVVDVEKDGRIDDLPSTAWSKTGGGGYHFYYKYNSEKPIGNFARVRELTDIRGEGGYIILPPSLHKSGSRYSWIKDLQEDSLAEFPEWLLNKVTKQQDPSTGPILEGSRNAAAASEAGRLVCEFKSSDWESEGWRRLEEWNQEKCTPPLDTRELRSVWESIKKMKTSEPVKDQKPNQTNTLVQLFLEEDPILFCDEMDEAYVQVQNGNSKKIFQCEGVQFGKYLSRLYYQKCKGTSSKESLAGAIRVISAEAELSKKKFPLHNRVAKLEGDFWYDLGEAKAIKCGKGAWSLSTEMPILFKKQRQQEEQVDPVSTGGDIKKLLYYFKIRKEGEGLLFLVWLVTTFIPDIPHPILVLHGEKGASKSTTLRLTKMLIDPSKMGLMTLPTKPDELVQQLAHNHAAFYDNVSHISHTISDILCRGVTGSGTSKRKLYTDDEDVIYNFKRVIALNGINNVVEAPDLLDRSILIEMDRVSKEERKTESDIDESFRADLPIILGGIFDTLARARSNFENVKVECLPRMADFAKWGHAISEALGEQGRKFIDAYNRNISKQNDEVLENDSVALALSILLEEKEEWEGTATELLTDLEKICEDRKLELDGKFPCTPSALGKRINQVKSNMREAGVTIEFKKDTTGKRGRSYSILKQVQPAVAPVAGVAESEVLNQDSIARDGSDRNSEQERIIEDLSWGGI